MGGWVFSINQGIMHSFIIEAEGELIINSLILYMSETR